MATIRNDQDLRHVLESLSSEQQRRIGGMFIESALDLCDDSIIRRAVQVAMDPESSDDVREDAFRSAKAYAVKTYTECGHDTDWTRQAAHFVGVATACLLADEQPGGDRAWRVAMQVRNARNCASIAEEGGNDIDDEAEQQRRIAREFADT
jgi:prophage DNA circulation protein